MTKGPILGTRVTTLSQVDDGNARIDVSWNFTPSGVPAFVHKMVEMEISNGTKEALRKIATELEQKTGDRNQLVSTTKEAIDKMSGFKTRIAMIIGVALIVSMTMNGVPTVAALDQIHSSREVSASIGKVWSTVSNLINDITWNQVDTLKVMKKTGNTIEADVTVGPQNANAHEIITLHPKQSVVTNITKGPVTGSRIVTLTPLSENKTNFTFHITYRMVNY